MTDKAKRGRGRPAGSKTYKAGPRLKASRMLDLVDACYDEEEWVRRFKGLSPESQFKYRSMLEPRAKEEAGPGIFCLLVDGLGTRGGKQYCPRCNWTSDNGFKDCFKKKEGSQGNE